MDSDRDPRPDDGQRPSCHAALRGQRNMRKMNVDRVKDDHLTVEFQFGLDPYAYLPQPTGKQNLGFRPCDLVLLQHRFRVGCESEQELGDRHAGEVTTLAPRTSMTL